MAAVQEAVRRLRIESTDTGVAQTTQKLQNLEQAHRGVAVASQGQEKATLSLERRLESIQRQYDRNYRAQATMAKVQRDLNAAEAQGLVTATRKNQLLAMAAERHRQAAASAGLHARALTALNARAATAAGAVLGAGAASLGLGGGGAIVGLLTGGKFFRETIDAEKAQAQLAAALLSTGNAAGQSVDGLNEHAKALQRLSTFSDEAVGGAQKILLQFTDIRGGTFQRATQAVADMAARLGGDLEPAALRLGRALQDPIKGMSQLGRVGITFTASQKEAAKALVETGDKAGAQVIILKQVELQFAGSARAARNTLGGALYALGNAFGDLFEVSGTGTSNLISAINRLTATFEDPATIAAVQNFGATLFNSLSKTIDYLRENEDVIVRILGAMAGMRFGRLAGPWGAAAGFGAGALSPELMRAYQRGISVDPNSGMMNFGASGSPIVSPSILPTLSWSRLQGMRGGSSSGAAGGPTQQQIDEMERLQKQFDTATASVVKQTSALQAEAAALTLGVGASTAFRQEQELLTLAEQNGLNLSPAQLASIHAKAEAYGAVTQKLVELRTMLDLTFEAEQMGRSPMEQKVASTLRGLYGEDFEQQMNGPIASQIRFNETLRIAQDLGRQFASGFVADLRSGATAVEALNNAVGRLGDRLLQMALDQAINMLFENLFGVFRAAASGGWTTTVTPAARGMVLSGGAVQAYALGGIVDRSLARFTSSSTVTPFAQGGVVNRPTIFPMARGAGLMGEAGPEAIMPLRRTAEGRLGVEARVPNFHQQPRYQGPAVVNNVRVINNSENTTTSQKETPNGSGGIDLEITIDNVVSGLMMKPGSKMNKTMSAMGSSLPRVPR